MRRAHASAVSSLQPSQTTTASNRSGPTVWPASASSTRSRDSRRLWVGMATLTIGPDAVGAPADANLGARPSDIGLRDYAKPECDVESPSPSEPHINSGHDAVALAYPSV